MGYLIKMAPNILISFCAKLSITYQTVTIYKHKRKVLVI